MFGKKGMRQTATESYVGEMIRSMLEEIKKVPRVYITQVDLHFSRQEKPGPWISTDYPLFLACRRVTGVIRFTGKGIPETDLGTRVRVEIDLVREQEGTPWKIFRAFLFFPFQRNLVTQERGSEEEERMDFHFYSSGHQATHSRIMAPSKLSNILNYAIWQQTLWSKYR
jgi:hypothetical protein